MKLDASFIRLPYRFDPEPLLTQISALPDTAWQPHPRGWTDHQVVPLIAADDDPARFEGVMAPSTHLQAVPKAAGLLSKLDAVLGRTLLVRAGASASAARMVDAGHYWHRRVRVFIPLQTGQDAWWSCGEDRLAIEAGGVWLLDGWRGYEHASGGHGELLYLVCDTVGSAAFWNTVKSADRPLMPGRENSMSPRRIKLADGDPAALETETVTLARVMSPWEMESLVGAVMDDVRAGAPDNAPHLPKLEAALDQFLRQWQGIHARHGDSEAGQAAYRQALEQLIAQAATFAGAWKLPNGLDAAQLLYQTVVAGALRDDRGRTVAVLPPQAAAGQAPAPAAPAPPPAAPPAATNAGDTPSPLRSVHTTSMAQLLKQAGCSLLVSTYQAGKLVVVRESEGKLNTHFRVYNRPMGMAADRGRLALGTAISVEFYRNMPDVAPKLNPTGRHDAAFLPRRACITGNIDVHEMDWAGDELWLVNTRFSCLCTLDGEHSFVPRWRPPFVSGYAAEDRCHLNGLEVVDGRPRYVTALGTSDIAGGWRENKAAGGILMDIISGDIICRGLSMPHSPRWYQGKLWVLESGNGSLATVDPASGRLDTVIELPGFTRGLDFLGPFAFVGLSQVRESAVFSGISLTEKVTERNCGVWVVDIRSGQLVGFLKFEDAVQEVFAVTVLPGVRYPDVLGGGDPQVAVSYALPETALKEVARSAPPA